MRSEVARLKRAVRLARAEAIGTTRAIACAHAVEPTAERRGQHIRERCAHERLLTHLRRAAHHVAVHDATVEKGGVAVVEKATAAAGAVGGERSVADDRRVARRQVAKCRKAAALGARATLRAHRVVDDRNRAELDRAPRT